MVLVTSYNMCNCLIFAGRPVRMWYWWVILTASVAPVLFFLSISIRSNNSLRKSDNSFSTRSNSSLRTSNNGNGNNYVDKDAIEGVKQINISFHEILKRRASVNNTIVLSSIDSAYVDMAINLYQTSLKKHNIDNYLFVGSDPDVCGALSKFDIACVDYIMDRDGQHASPYGSKAFKRKTHLKTKMILEALMVGLKVLITDVDIVFLKNPLQYLNCHECDIEISEDGRTENSGFYLVRPTSASIKLHRDSWELGLAQPGLSNQGAIHKVMNKMVGDKAITVKKLNLTSYANGQAYFEIGQRMFKGDNPCDECVIVHNNWIVSGEAKVYRFKECGLWEYDKNKYYSDETNKYITFGLPVDYGVTGTRPAEMKALKNALIIGEVLNRIVILPQFHCYGCDKKLPACRKPGGKCTFGTFYKVSTFESHFKGKYRESVFLSHAEVPDTVKNSISPMYYIDASAKREDLIEVPHSVTKVVPQNSEGATLDEIIQWFGGLTDSVVRFHSLYHGINYDKVEDKVKIKNVLKRIEEGLRKSDYRQYA